jgi:hypothetical protein
VDRGQKRTKDLEPQMLGTVEVNPSTSTQQLVLEFQVSQFVVCRVRVVPLSCSVGASIATKRLHYYISRQEFCEWAIQKCVDPPNFLRTVLFTDEAGFTRNRVFNSHNTAVQ